MVKDKSWFAVSRKGLRELQEGKPKHFILRELVQNAWDEETKKCAVEGKWNKGHAFITVEDDNPEGFKDLSHSFTLFAPTEKRSDPEKRGRFNLGEKQVLALCEVASVATTKGVMFFDDRGRRHSKEKREFGSKVSVKVKMTKQEYEEMMEVVKTYLIPRGIGLSVNGERIEYRKPDYVVEAVLPTEIEEGGVLRPTKRKTKIHILRRNDKGQLYELGLPVCEIDCAYDVDVQQKVPLSPDREKVSSSYLSQIYAEVLNATHEELTEEHSSDVWIRNATANKRVSKEAVKSVIQKRYGERAVVANPKDRNSIDEAISKGYRVVYGQELSKEEWENIRSAEAIPSSSELFGETWTTGKTVEPDENMQAVAKLAERIAERCLGVTITIKFSEWESTVAAQYGNCTLTFNVGRLGRGFFKPRISTEILDLIIHELAHEEGRHIEAGYHEAMTKMGGQLVMIALKEPDFFTVA